MGEKNKQEKNFQSGSYFALAGLTRAAWKAKREAAWTEPSELIVGEVGGKFANHKFLDEVGGCGGANADGGIFESECDAVAIFGWVIEIGDAAGGKAPGDRGISRLPFSIVAFANNGIGEGIENSRALAASAFVKITGILFEERRQDGAADVGANKLVAVGSAVAIGVTLSALPVAAELIPGLLDS